MKYLILCLVIASMLVGVWLFASVFLSTGDEWWSLYTFNMEDMSPYNLEIAWLKVLIVGVISLVIGVGGRNCGEESDHDSSCYYC